MQLLDFNSECAQKEDYEPTINYMWPSYMFPLQEKGSSHPTPYRGKSLFAPGHHFLETLFLQQKGMTKLCKMLLHFLRKTIYREA